MTALVISALFVGLSGCQKKEGPVERLGKEIDKSVEKAGQQMEKPVIKSRIRPEKPIKNSLR